MCTWLQVPEHLREDFCGTALVAATWCRGDVRRTAIGIDFDRRVLLWGLDHNVLAHDLGGRICLFQNNVLGADEVAALVTPSLAGLLAQSGQGCPVPVVTTSQADRSSTTSARVSTEVGEKQEDKVPSLSEETALSHIQQEGSSQDRSVFVKGADVEQQDLKLCDVSAEGVSRSSDMECHAQCTEGGNAQQSLLGLDLLKRPCDVVCALNYCICLLHSVEDLNHYLRKSRAVIGESGGIFVADLLGGNGAESSLKVSRRNHVTGVQFQWEQEGFDPVTRRLHAYLSLQHQPSRRTFKNAFHYHWRLWTIPDIEDALYTAGFDEVKIWLRPMGADVLCDVSAKEQVSSEEESVSISYEEYKPGMAMREYEGGWSAYVIGVVTSQHACV